MAVSDLQESMEDCDDRSKLKMACLFECNGCFKNYSGNLIPRLLVCGHSLCTTCVEKFTVDLSSCPECNQKEPKRSLDKYPINCSLLRVVKSIPIRDVQLGCDSINLLSKVFNKSDHKDSWYCGAHERPICLFCYSCTSWMCQDCLVVDHPVLPRGSCRVIEFVDALQKIECQYKKAADETSKDIESIKKNFDHDMTIHDFCLKHCTRERSHLRIIEHVEDCTEVKRESNESVVQDTQKRLKELTDSDRATSQEKLTSSIQALISFKEELQEIIRDEEDKLFAAMLPICKHLRLDLKRLAGTTKPLYAIINEEENAMFAQITVKDQRLLLCPFQKGKPSEDCVTVPYGFVRKLVPKQRTTLFFEVGTAEESFGRVYILMNDCENIDNCLQRKQMLLMCTGELGVSYKGTIFYRYDENRLLHGGDYENGDGTGGRPIIEGIRESCIAGLLEHQSKYGALIGSQESARFTFYLKHQLGEYVSDYIGKVYDGLAILKTVSKLEPVTKAVIRDCGVVIPMKLKNSSGESDCMDPDDDLESC